MVEVLTPFLLSLGLKTVKRVLGGAWVLVKDWLLSAFAIGVGPSPGEGTGGRSLSAGWRAGRDGS